VWFGEPEEGTQQWRVSRDRAAVGQSRRCLAAFGPREIIVGRRMAVRSGRGGPNGD
jgi:hypothetical protein